MARKVVDPRPPQNHFCCFLVANVDEFSKNGSTNEILGGPGVDDFFNPFQTGSTFGKKPANTVSRRLFSIVLNRAKSRRLSTTFRTHAVSSDLTQNSGCREKRYTGAFLTSEPTRSPQPARDFIPSHFRFLRVLAVAGGQLLPRR